MTQIAELSLFIYKKDFKEILLFFVLSIFIWAVIGLKLSKRDWAVRVWKVVNCVTFVLIFVAILYLTIFSRGISEGYEVCVIPFYSLVLAKENEEIYRSMLMNILFFEPLGLALPFVLSDKFRKKAVMTIVFGFLLSAVIEIIQYVFHLGRAEVDDAICNTLGCAIGTGAYLIYKKE